MSKELVSKFREEALKHGSAIEEGNSKHANKAYEVVHQCYLSLKEDNQLIELEMLLDDESPYVRLWTSRYMLQVCTDKSEKVLFELGLLEGISVAFDARMTLSEWKDGNLLF